MITEGTLYRPPVEANTFLLQITAGCTHNGCRFCNMYKDKSFHLIDEDIVVEEVKDNNELDYVLSQFALSKDDEDEFDE